MKQLSYVTLDRASLTCGVAPTTLRNWAGRARIPLIRASDGCSIRRQDLHRCLALHGLRFPREMETWPRLLLVDDDPDQLSFMAEALRSIWMETHIATARDGESALAKLDAEPDLLVVDFHLPGLTGGSICRRVRERRELSHTKVLAITAHHNPRTNHMLLENGADEYLPKPFAARDLRGAALRLLGLVTV
jgi:CheY-like chemotaxis protein